MSFPHDEDFTRKLNERIKELENMTNEIDGQREEMEGFASKNDETTELNDQANETTDETTEVNEEQANQAEAPRQEGETIFFTAKLDTTKPLKLTVTNNNGDIEVQGTDSDSVEIEATRNSGEEVDHAHWFFQQLDNEITLRPNWQVGSHVSDLASKLKNQLKQGFNTSQWSSKDFKFGLDVNYDLVVRLPKNLVEGSRVSIKTANGDGQLRDVNGEVDFKTANGDLQVTGVAGALTINSANGDLGATDIAGNVNASTANGDISLKDIAGAIESNTANGDVRVEDANGPISVRTANGDIQVLESSWKGGRLVTVAGDINVEAALVRNASYQFDTVSGSVEVEARVPSKGATFTAKSITGEIEVDGEFVKNGKREWTIGDGEIKMSAKSVSGDIHVAATTDSGLELEDAVAEDEKVNDDQASESKRSGEVNVNVDFELERAKGWLKDVSTKLGAFVGELDAKRAEEPKEPVAPQAPEAPQAPVPPVSPEQAAATADRRTRLLEAVKNGEMTVDEALAELERDV